jgi:hypothetical protein
MLNRDKCPDDGGSKHLFNVGKLRLHGGTSQKTVILKMAVFWNVAPCSLVEVYRCFRGATIQKIAIFILAAVRTLNLT